jgi:hypothetical protein
MQCSRARPIFNVNEKRGAQVLSSHIVRNTARIIAQETVDDLEAALEQFRLIANDLGSDTSEKVT